MERTELTALFTSALDDAKRLVALEAKLLKLELLELGVRTRRTGALAFAALVLAVPALVMAAFALAGLVQEWTEWTETASYAAVSGLLILGTLACLWRAKKIWEVKESTDGKRSEARAIAARDRGYDAFPAQ